MSCLVTQNIPVACESVLGGVKRVYIGAFTPGTTNSATGVISTFTGTMYKFEAKKNTASLEVVINTSPENGTLYYTSTLTLPIHKQDASKSYLMADLIKKNPQVIVVDSNDKAWVVGLTFGANINFTSSTGANLADSNGYILTVVAEDKVVPYQVTAVLPA